MNKGEPPIIIRETEPLAERKYIVAYVSDSWISPMGHTKGWTYAKDVCDKHNKANPGCWQIFEIKKVYPNGN